MITHAVTWEGKAGDPLCGEFEAMLSLFNAAAKFTNPRNESIITCEKCQLMIAIGKANKINLALPGARSAIQKLMEQEQS